jgi:hypothetical protein
MKGQVAHLLNAVGSKYGRAVIPVPPSLNQLQVIALLNTPSCIRLMPGPEDAVMALTPAEAAPKTIWMAPSSLSAGMKTPPDNGKSRDAVSAISLAGVMG